MAHCSGMCRDLSQPGLADAAGLPAPATDPAHASKRASKVNGDLTNQDGNTRRNSVNAGGAAHRALRPDRPSAERVAAQRYLRVVAAEARRLSVASGSGRKAAALIKSAGMATKEKR
jgi:hypothetical protein